MLVLGLDIAGNPASWIPPREAVRLLVSGRALANLGEHELLFRGGHNARTGVRSTVRVGSILLTREQVRGHLMEQRYEPPLSNRLLFQRDGYICLYCGVAKPAQQLTRDHVIPRAQGGEDRWSNVVSCCRRCNGEKGNRTPEQWGRHLIAVPYCPNHAEFMYLQNSRRIVTDQQQFLMERFPSGSRLLS